MSEHTSLAPRERVKVIRKKQHMRRKQNQQELKQLSVSTSRQDQPASRSVSAASPEKILEPAEYVPSQLLTGQRKGMADLLRTRCWQLGTPLFFQQDTAVRSLGFTSAISGEGKTFFARLMAEIMTEDKSVSMTLLECNWERPMLSSAYHLASGPGLSEWLGDQCELSEIRQQVTSRLTVIAAGETSSHTAHLLQKLQQKDIHSVLTNPDEILLVDLPAMVTTAYGLLAAQLVDALMLIIHKGVTPESLVTEACHSLRDLPVQGIIFNQVASHIPRWLRRML